MLFRSESDMDDSKAIPIKDTTIEVPKAKDIDLPEKEEHSEEDLFIDSPNNKKRNIIILIVLVLFLALFAIIAIINHKNNSSIATVPNVENIKTSAAQKN